MSADPRLEEFKLFLSTAPVNWSANQTIRRFALPGGESVSCVLWNELFHISGTDIVRSIIYRFECMGRKVVQQKKFEEGIFSDLRNLKPQKDATLEDSRSPFLKFLYDHQCIRTQKKQKVFYWFSVKHDKLFMDALERDLKRENAGQNPCSISMSPMSSNKAVEVAKMHFLPESNNQSMSDAQSLGMAKMSQNTTSIMGSPSQSLGLSPQKHLHGTYSPIQSHISPMMMHSTISLGGSPELMPEQPMSQLSGRSYQDNIYPYGNMHASNMPSMLNPDYHDPYAQSKSQFMDPLFDHHDHIHPGSEPNRAAPYNLNRMRNGRRSSFGSPDKVFTCPFATCGRPFKRQEHLRRHLRLHTGERPYVCTVPECRRSFSRSDHLAHHMRTHPESPAPQDWSLNNMHHHLMPTKPDFETNLLGLSSFDPYDKESLLGSEYSGSVVNDQMDSLMSDMLALDPDLPNPLDHSSLLSY